MAMVRVGGFILAAAILAGCSSKGDMESMNTRWQMHNDGIKMEVSGEWKDHFAMSGRMMDTIVEWSINADGAFDAVRLCRFPMLRRIPDNTHASLSIRLYDTELPRPTADGEDIGTGKAQRVFLNGILEVTSDYEKFAARHLIFPAQSAQAMFDYYEFTNITDKSVTLRIPSYLHESETAPGVFGVYIVTTRIIGSGVFTLAPGESANYSVIRSARRADEPPFFAEPFAELAARQAFIEETAERLTLETPVPELNKLFDMAKFHALESIFATRGGPMHAPGGYGSYLAAIWANDQAEYANPFFPFLGNPVGDESALNSFRHFARYMNDDFKAIPSSIIAEGRGFWNGAGDRGDMAMIAHGASRFVLASGNHEWARELLPLIDWSLEFCRRKITPDGIVASDSDELENRFPSGDANLCTSTLFYDALLRTADIYDAFGNPAKADALRSEAARIRQAIIAYFGAEIEGYKTYRYYDGNTVLRSWICMPLVFGIDHNERGTVEALFSDLLWMGDGLLCASDNRRTYWDRSTLYALRGVFFSGYADEALPRLVSYARTRLLGDHVPYPIEAYPENNQSHLSAESALFCRVFTEGMFGIEPTGFDSFHCTINMPAEWNKIALRKCHAFGRVFDLEAERKGDTMVITLTDSAGTVIDTKEAAPGQRVQLRTK